LPGRNSAVACQAGGLRTSLDGHGTWVHCHSASNSWRQQSRCHRDRRAAWHAPPTKNVVDSRRSFVLPLSNGAPRLEEAPQQQGLPFPPQSPMCSPRQPPETIGVLLTRTPIMQAEHAGAQWPAAWPANCTAPTAGLGHTRGRLSHSPPALSTRRKTAPRLQSHISQSLRTCDAARTGRREHPAQSCSERWG